MNENKRPFSKVYDNSHIAISLPIKPAFIPLGILESVENTVDFWLKKCKAEDKYGKYKGKEIILHIEINEDGEKYFTLEVCGYFADMILNENIDVIFPPEREESYLKEAFEHIAKNYLP